MTIIKTKIKQTGIPWIGEIPENWELSRIKNEFKISKKIVGEDSKKYQLLSLTLKGIITRDIESGFGKFPAEFNTYQPVEPNDLVLCLFDIEETPRTIGLSYNYGMITGAYTVLKNINNNIFNKYYYYLFLMVDQDKKFRIYYSGLRNTIKDLTFQSIPLPVPPIKTQETISTFLDQKTTQITTFIKNKKRLIELLEEQKISIINKAVTKGLDENVKMKDSGIPWIGEIPEGWEVKKLKTIANITRGAILRPVDEPLYYDENGEWTYLNISDVSNCGRYLYSGKLLLSELGSTKSTRIEKDNLIITASATIGIPFINKIDVCIHDGFIAFKNIVIEKLFLYYFLLNKELYNAIGKSSTQKNIYLSEVKEIMIVIPSNFKQTQIVKYLDEKLEKINQTIKTIEKEIKLIEEYRDSLIYQSVTGKLNIQ